jgi:hypothetical protein
MKLRVVFEIDEEYEEACDNCGANCFFNGHDGDVHWDGCILAGNTNMFERFLDQSCEQRPPGCPITSIEMIE